jgi:transposase-like protein
VPNLNERLAIIRGVADLESQGYTFTLACDHFKVSRSTVTFWRRKYAAGGLQALENKESSGRPPISAALSPEAITKIRELVLKTDSVKLAYEIFSNDPLCPDQVRESIQGPKVSGHDIALSLRRVAYITPEVKALHRGEKTFDSMGFVNLRDMTELMPDGTRRPIKAGDWWELDDMSMNQPFRYPLSPDAQTRQGTADRLAQKYGCGIGRQSLWCMDVASGKFLGFELIGRARDAYRAEDILRFLRKLFTSWGVPRRGLRLERGVWKSRRIRGAEINMTGWDQADRDDYAEVIQDYEHPEMEETERKVIVGGLQKLGLEVVYCWNSHQKGLIESSFDHLQSLMNVMGDK